MSFLLDTNACIAVMNRHPISVRKRLAQEIIAGAAFAVSAISVVELQYGVAKSQRVEANAANLDDFLQPIRVLAFDDADAKIAGEIRVDLERQGKPIGPYDCLIAAQGLRHNLCVVTANVSEFSRVEGLRWENWAT